MTQHVLALDIAGNPFRWITTAEAIHYYAADKVIWDLGDREFTFRGGFSNDGVQSIIHAKSIIAVAGDDHERLVKSFNVAMGKDNRLLYARDRDTCAYCGNVFPYHRLSRDHVLARCRGGLDIWTNCVTACRKCNQAKGHKLVHDFKPLLYVPYVPCRFEHFILSGRNVMADQHAYLAARLPKHSRLL